jgi:hypothetical protein
VFGDAMFGKKNNTAIRGKQVGVVNILWKMLKRKERLGELVAITIDEYLTSQARIMEVLETDEFIILIIFFSIRFVTIVTADG